MRLAPLRRPAPRRPDARPAFRAGRAPRSTLAGAALLAVALPAWLWSLHGWWYVQWQQLDLRIFYYGSRVLTHHQSYLYGRDFGGLHLPFIYPPFAAVLLLFGSLLGFGVLRVGVLLAIVVCTGAVCWASTGMLGRRGDPRRIGLVLGCTAVAVWLEPVMWTLEWGQVNVFLLAAVVLDLALPDSSRWKGVGTGLAAGFKLTPGLFVLYLLLTRRFRAAATATASFAGTVLLGLAAAPGPSLYYWTHLGAVSARVNHRLGLEDINNQSLNGMLVRLLHETPAEHLLWTALCGALALLGLAAAVAAHRRGRELLAVTLCGVLTVLVSPLSWSHHWVWVVPGLVLLADLALRRRTYWTAAALGGYVALGLSWPLPLPGRGRFRHALAPRGVMWLADGGRRGAEYHWNAWRTLIGNQYTVCGAAFVLIAAYFLVIVRRQRTPSAVRCVRTAGPSSPPDSR